MLIPARGCFFLQVAGSMLAGALFVMRQKIRKLLRLGKPEDEKALEADPIADETGTGLAA